MGSFMSQSASVDPKQEYNVVIINEPNTTLSVLNNYGSYNVKVVREANIEDAKQKIKNEELDLLIVFDEDFDDKISVYQIPNVSLFYNSISKNSTPFLTLYISSCLPSSIPYLPDKV